MKDKNYAPDLSDGDFLTNRKTTIESMNLSTLLIKQNREGIYSKLFYVFSLLFGVLIAIFSSYLNWTMVLLFVDFSLLFLVWSAKEYNKRRQELVKDHYKIIDRLKEFGIKIDKI